MTLRSPVWPARLAWSVSGDTGSSVVHKIRTFMRLSSWIGVHSGLASWSLTVFQMAGALDGVSGSVTPK